MRKWLVCIVHDTHDDSQFTEASAREIVRWLKANLSRNADDGVKIQLREGPYLDSVHEVRVRPAE